MRFKECENCSYRREENELGFDELVCPNCDTDLEEFEE